MKFKIFECGWVGRIRWYKDGYVLGLVIVKSLMYLRKLFIIINVSDVNNNEDCVSI